MKLIIDIPEEVLTDINESTYPNDRLVGEVIYAVKNGTEPKKGRWIEQENGKFLQCSECKTLFLEEFLDEKNFCAKCGADMTEPTKADKGMRTCENCKHYKDSDWVYDGNDESLVVYCPYSDRDYGCSSLELVAKNCSYYKADKE